MKSGGIVDGLAARRTADFFARDGADPRRPVMGLRRAAYAFSPAGTDRAYTVHGERAVVDGDGWGGTKIRVRG